MSKSDALIRSFHDARRSRNAGLDCDAGAVDAAMEGSATESDREDRPRWVEPAPFQPLPVQAIVPNPHSERGPVYGAGAPDAEVAETVRLAESIARRGLLHPIGVKAIAGSRWQVVYGDRRLAAHIHLRRPTVLALVLVIPDVSEHITFTIVENLTHRSLRPRQRSAELWRLAAERFGVTPGAEVTRAQANELAQIIGVTPRTVWRMLAILRAAETSTAPAVDPAVRVRRAVRSAHSVLAAAKGPFDSVAPTTRRSLVRGLRDLQQVTGRLLAEIAGTES